MDTWWYATQISPIASNRETPKSPKASGLVAPVYVMWQRSGTCWEDVVAPLHQFLGQIA